MGDAQTWIRSVSDQLLSEPQPMPDRADLVPDWMPEAGLDRPPVPAAVLIALVRRAAGFTLLYTARSSRLRSHSGQVAFPGGRIDPEDIDAAYAALREAREEVDLDPADAEVLGYMPYYFTGTNYFITPVVAVVEPRGPFTPNPDEVEAVFEVPLERILVDTSFAPHRVERNGRAHQTWRIDHEGHRIWGITANLTRRLRKTLIASGAGP